PRHAGLNTAARPFSRHVHPAADAEGEARSIRRALTLIARRRRIDLHHSRSGRRQDVDLVAERIIHVTADAFVGVRAESHFYPTRAMRICILPVNVQIALRVGAHLSVVYVSGLIVGNLRRPGAAGVDEIVVHVLPARVQHIDLDRGVVGAPVGRREDGRLNRAVPPQLVEPAVVDPSGAADGRVSSSSTISSARLKAISSATGWVTSRAVGMRCTWRRAYARTTGSVLDSCATPCSSSTCN